MKVLVGNRTVKTWVSDLDSDLVFVPDSLQVWWGHTAASSATRFTIYNPHSHQQWNTGNQCQVLKTRTWSQDRTRPRTRIKAQSKALKTWTRARTRSWTRTRISRTTTTIRRRPRAGTRTNTRNRSSTRTRQIIQIRFWSRTWSRTRSSWRSWVSSPWRLKMAVSFLTVKPAAVTKWFLSTVTTNVRTLWNKFFSRLKVVLCVINDVFHVENDGTLCVFQLVVFNRSLMTRGRWTNQQRGYQVKVKDWILFSGWIWHFLIWSSFFSLTVVFVATCQVWSEW